MVKYRGDIKKTVAPLVAGDYGLRNDPAYHDIVTALIDQSTFVYPGDIKVSTFSSLN